MKLEYAFNGHNITTEKVPVEELRAAEGAQRDLNEKRAKDIAASFKFFAMGTVTASRRSDGYLYLVDGQHRVAALKLVLEELRSRADSAEEIGNVGEAEHLRAEADSMTDVMVEVHHDLSRQEEATLFLIKNRESSKPNAVDQFIVGRNAGLSPYIETGMVLDAHGLYVGRREGGKVGDRVSAITAFLEVVSKYGADSLDDAIKVADRCWGGPNRVKSTWDGGLIGGLGMLFGEHKGQVNADRVVDVILGVASPKRLAVNPTDPTVWVKENQIASQSAAGFGTSTLSRVKVAYRGFYDLYNKGLAKAQKLSAPE